MKYRDINPDSLGDLPGMVDNGLGSLIMCGGGSVNSELARGLAQSKYGIEVIILLGGMSWLNRHISQTIIEQDIDSLNSVPQIFCMIEQSSCKKYYPFVFNGIKKAIYQPDYRKVADQIYKKFAK
jgi:hypothetical protein